jgi:hypothetical protein
MLIIEVGRSRLTRLTAHRRLVKNSFLTPFNLGGSLAGLDLSPDGNTLVSESTEINDSYDARRLSPHGHHRREHRRDRLLRRAFERVEVARADRYVAPRALDACARYEATPARGRE